MYRIKKIRAKRHRRRPLRIMRIPKSSTKSTSKSKQLVFMCFFRVSRCTSNRQIFLKVLFCFLLNVLQTKWRRNKKYSLFEVGNDRFDQDNVMRELLVVCKRILTSVFWSFFIMIYWNFHKFCLFLFIDI